MSHENQWVQKIKCEFIKNLAPIKTLFYLIQEVFPANSPVHVVLVSLLVDQLSGLFLFFLVDQKKIVQSQGIFGQSLGIFG